MASIGDVYIDVHANNAPFDREIGSNLERSADAAEGNLNRTGKDFGDKIADSMTEELGRHGKDFGRAIEDSTRGTTVRVRSDIDYHNVRDSRGRFAKRITDEIADALTDAAGPRGPFARVGGVITDAIAAGFNVSGKSPLLPFLVPLVGAIIGLVTAALQAIGVLGAALAALPALLTAIGLQAGTLVMAFSGVGTAISKAFASEDPEELEAALANLTPAAQAFVRSLLPIRDIFQDIQRMVQERFFIAFGDSLANAARALAPILRGGFGTLATSMGNLFRQLADFFGSPTFVEFVRNVFPATARFLAQLGPGLVTFLTGLIDIANAALPFLTSMGTIITNTLAQIGLNLTDIANDPAFNQWLKDMGVTLGSVVELLFTASNFIAAFLGALNAAGGDDVIMELANAFAQLAAFLASPVGVEGMKALVNISIIGIQVFFGLVEALFAVLAAFSFMSEAIAAFLSWAGQGIVDFFTWVGQSIVDFYNWVTGKGKEFVTGAAESANRLVGFVAKLPGRIIGALGDLGQRMFNAGRNLIESLGNGIREQFGSLWNVMKEAADIVGRFLPGSPAKVGPLSGSGYSLLRGQRMIQDFAAGISMEGAALRTASAEATSNVIFGPNSIQMRFSGPVPNEGQARRAGAAMGTSAAGIIAARDARLAMRSL